MTGHRRWQGWHRCLMGPGHVWTRLMRSFIEVGASCEEIREKQPDEMGNDRAFILHGGNFRITILSPLTVSWTRAIRTRFHCVHWPFENLCSLLGRVEYMIRNQLDG